MAAELIDNYLLDKRFVRELEDILMMLLKNNLNDARSKIYNLPRSKNTLKRL